LQIIKKDDTTYATIGSIKDTTDGWNFNSDLNSPLQWGTGLFQKGGNLQPHFHRVRSRVRAHKTLEFIYVVKGSIWVDFYSEKELFLSKHLVEGDFVYFTDGIHGIRIDKDNTYLIEVKNGPFSSKDKERI
jgi:hypothetical protein